MNCSQLTEYMYGRLPEIYRAKDEEQIPPYPLKRFLCALVEGGMYPLMADSSDLLKVVNPETCPAELFPLLCQSFGFEYFEDIPIVYQRRFLLNFGELTRRRGTYACIRYLVATLTGMSVSMTCERKTVEGVEGQYLRVVALANTVEQLDAMTMNLEVITRYITKFIPYYVFVDTEASVAVSRSIFMDRFRVNIVISASYTLVGL